MSNRYSGDLKLSIRLLADNETYNVKVSCLDDPTVTVHVKGIKLSPYARLRIAADSKAAYDEVARVGLSFAANDSPCGELLTNSACVDDRGEFAVQRRYAGETVERRFRQ